MIKKYLGLVVGVLTMMVAGCSSSSKKVETVETQIATEKEESVMIEFNGDSAYSYVAAQCAFGPRVPNTEAHRRAAVYFENELKRHGAEVIVQKMELNAFDGTVLDARNIIGVINPTAEKRILLMAHWDCRPWADNDPVEANHKKPVMGANDGASGVGVLLEIARVFKDQKINVGVDILLTDAEDWGDSHGDNDKSWALGTQYWVNNKHVANYKPMFGILLDMVGTKDARFYKEYFSMHYASQVTDMIWDVADNLGYSEYFVSQPGGAYTDDHIFINKGGIPCVDIIDQNAGDGEVGFFSGWHTVNDDMDNISAETLKVVGQTVVNVITSM